MDNIAEYSWGQVLQENASNLTHVLDFPYNGEPNHDCLMEDAVTPSKHHFVFYHGGISQMHQSRIIQGKNRRQSQ